MCCPMQMEMRYHFSPQLFQLRIDFFYSECAKNTLFLQIKDHVIIYEIIQL